MNTTKDPNAPAQIVLRTTMGKKGELVRKARERGQKLNAYCMDVLERDANAVEIVLPPTALHVLPTKEDAAKFSKEHLTPES